MITATCSVAGKNRKRVALIQPLFASAPHTQQVHGATHLASHVQFGDTSGIRD
jgi:hypothetical protein